MQNLDHFIFKDKQIEMDFILFGVDQAEIKHSEKALLVKEINKI